MKKIKKKLSKFLIPFLMAVFTFVFFKNIILIGYVPTESMEPTLKSGSYILGNRLYTSLNKGDIIIFYHENQLLVKRIAAIEGEYIEKNGEIMCVPMDHYYVLGDNEENSYDSRYWEKPFIRSEDIIAKLI